MVTPDLLKELATSMVRPYSWWTTKSCGGTMRNSGGTCGFQAYYAVKANPDPAIVRTLYERGPASTWRRCPSS